ncbi:MAG: OsmC family protein [Candidatus Aminicenantes bacterium]|nr:OsmC family protein [Candidatus Aminicenantes bacterium]
MPIREASAIWNGDLKRGKGTMTLGSGAYEGAYSFASRFEKGTGTNPEELIGAAHAGCFSMSLANSLAKAGYSPEQISTRARVSLELIEGSFKISEIVLETKAKVQNIEKNIFLKRADDAKANCPVSKALTGTHIKLLASLDKQ